MWIELLISLVVVALFIGIYYAVTGIPPGAKLIEQRPPLSTTNLDDNQAKFMFFYTTWCPHCKKAQQPVASFKEMVKNRRYRYGNKEIIFEEINAEADKGKSALYQIKAYPTFKLETSDKVYEMLGPPSVEAFRAFLESALGSEKAV